MAKKKQSKKASSKDNDALILSVIGLVVNLVLPGLGTIIGGKTKKGIIQFFLSVLAFMVFIVGLPLLAVGFIGLPLVFLGILSMLIIWVLALITSIQLIAESN